KRYPSCGITVIERNGPDDTFGWGVVFSDKTLSYLQANDEKTYQDILKSFATWENVDVVHKNTKISIRGNKFSGIARIEMLHILQRRCEELGVDMKFRTEVIDLDAFKNYDLIVGADGVNSFIRKKYERFFKPDLSMRTNKYIWYGTHQLFHGLTLTFHQNKDGIFAAHSYKFNTTTSTFIVECDEGTWRKAGLDAMTEPESRKYLENVFKNDLNGHELLSNNSKWINFLLVKNKHWSHGNIVLLGDALHTAHFSIGSGTKLALEDSIALFHAVENTSDMQAALAEFERVRRPVVDEYQNAAYESLVWFENLKDSIDLAPLPFAYKLMTRSKKIDHENLKKRDPEFIAAYDALKA
ncbi:MAG TPA: FAD-dependent monooxygenase, partial [Candidatus Kapabacteria bacterium]|nr:FAD-dependent monooxygenase [Candidatus Kapabacteria bacterium]